MRFSLSCLMVLIWSVLAFGQCRNGSCQLPPSRSVPLEAETYWKVWPSNPTQAFLHEGGKCRGGFDFSSGCFRSWDGQSWGHETASKIPVPQAAFSFSQTVDDFPTGVETEKLSGKEAYYLNGKPTTERALRDQLSPQSFQQIPDDSSKRHLTFIGKDAATLKGIKADMEKPAVASLSKLFRVQAYDASDKVEAEMLSPFRLADDSKFQKSGRMVCVQMPAVEGKAPVFSCIYEWGGPDELGEFMRKADPNYDPNKTPAPKTPAPKTPPDDKSKTPVDPNGVSSTMVWCCVAGGALALFLLNRRSVV